jgi:hypothetical protein
MDVNTTVGCLYGSTHTTAAKLEPGLLQPPCSVHKLFMHATCICLFQQPGEYLASMLGRMQVALPTSKLKS